MCLFCNASGESDDAVGFASSERSEFSRELHNLAAIAQGTCCETKASLRQPVACATFYRYLRGAVRLFRLEALTQP
jgi:hypothetical protein